jgi:hypothetical protein
MRPRFSLRWLLLFTALVATLCYAWVAWPTTHAERFAAALNGYDPVAWSTFFNAPATGIQNGPRIVFKDREEVEEIVRVILGGVGATADLLPQTREDLLRGQRRIAVRGTPQHIQIDLISSPGPVAFVLIDRLGKISRSDLP